jgi:glucan biosynthesis protein C
LGFFILLAGYFTPGSFDRKGHVRFYIERLVRLGIPLLIYVWLLGPLIQFSIQLRARSAGRSFLEIWGLDGAFWRFRKQHVSNYSRYGPDVGPMWFVEMLLILIIAYGLGRLVFGLFKSAPRFRESIARKAVPGLWSTAILALALGLAVFVMRIWRPANSTYKPLGLPTAYVPQYIGLFFVGVMAYRGDWFQRMPPRTGRVWLGIILFFVLVLLPLIFVLGGPLKGNTYALLGGVTWQSFAFSVWEEFVCVGAIIVLLIGFRERFDRQSALAKAMSDSTFTVYFIHAPVLVFLALALRGWDLYPLLKWALVSPVAILSCFLIAYLLRKVPLLRKIL